MREDASGARSRLILDLAPDAFIAADRSGAITDWNAKAEDTFGWKRDEALGRDLVTTLIPPDQRTSYKRAARTGALVELEAVRRGGMRFPIEVAIRTLEDETSYAFIRDITGRHTTQELLRARERQLSEALSLANLGSWSWDIETNDVAWSDDLYLIFGLDPSTPVDFDSYMSRVHPDDRASVGSTIVGATRDVAPFEFEHRIVREDGSVRWLHCHGEVVGDEHRPERVYATAEDVTDDRQAERTRSLLAAIVESTDDAIKSMATDGTIISWNAAAEQLYGYTAEEFLGHPVLELFPPEEIDGVLAVFGRVVEGGHVERCELKQIRKDGEIIDVGATLSPIRVGGMIVGVSAVSRNITARKHAEQALHSALEREQTTVRDLQELDRMRSDFISNVSHELRTPLTSISGYAELLAGGSFGDINGEQGVALDVIDRNTKRLLDLIEDILALSRMESGVYSLSLEPTDLTALIRSAGEAITTAAEAKSIELTVDVESNIGFALVDASQLDRALLNVLSNAIKFTPLGGFVRLHAGRSRGKVFITVEDNGMGIDPGDQKQVFKRFFRSSLATRSAIQGTGLGLVITKTIVDHHKGSIDLDSAPGRGTTVRIAIPVAPSAIAV